MRGVRNRLLAALFVSFALLVVAGCGSSSKTSAPAVMTTAAQAAPQCAYRAGWQKLANRIKAAVYCPGWLPDPLTSQLGGQWNNINSVSPDRSYLMSFVWQETGMGIGGGELHVNLRGYPGVTKIPSCTRGGGDHTPIPCFDQPNGSMTTNGIKATVYTVNQDADAWHILLLWHAHDGLYTLSEHLAPPLTYNKLLKYLRHELSQLVVIEPNLKT